MQDWEIKIYEQNQNQTANYRGYTIVTKQDWGKSRGHYIDGFYVRTGYIVTDGICNIVPGAGWFQTPSKARTWIDDAIARGDIEDKRKVQYGAA